jgi:peptidoglycan hydrolase-like protein with peptidoglycan-binding domain
VPPLQSGIQDTNEVKPPQPQGLIGKANSATLAQLTGPFAFGNSTKSQTKILQELLSLDKEVYPEGLITGYFGPLTKKAVERFQRKYGVILPGSTDEIYLGYPGPKTRAKIREIFGNQVKIEDKKPTEKVLQPATPPVVYSPDRFALEAQLRILQEQLIKLLEEQKTRLLAN